MTFVDMHTRQLWGRYVVSETVTVPKYEYTAVKERVWVPVWVQEPQATTMTHYDSIVSYQLQPRSIPSMNPFAQPQQIMEYAPIVQYQPRNVQVMQMTTYQKYEEREIDRMVPKLVNASEQRARFVDRPLTSDPSDGPKLSNLVQESAMVAQANRTSARYATRSIDYGTPSFAMGASPALWTAPQTLVPPGPPSAASSQVPATMASYATAMPPTTIASPPSSILVGNGVTYSAALVPVPSPNLAYNPIASAPNPAFYAGQLAPPAAGPSALVAMGPTPQNGMPPYPPNGYPPNGYPPAGYPPAGYPPGANAAAPSSFAWLTGNQTLFPTTMFSTQSASTMPTPGGAPANVSAISSNAPVFLRKNSPTPPPPTYGVNPSAAPVAGAPAPPYRDPMQAGLPPTVLQ